METLLPSWLFSLVYASFLYVNNYGKGLWMWTRCQSRSTASIRWTDLRFAFFRPRKQCQCEFSRSDSNIFCMMRDVHVCCNHSFILRDWILNSFIRCCRLNFSFRHANPSFSLSPFGYCARTAIHSFVGKSPSKTWCLIFRRYECFVHFATKKPHYTGQ